MNRTTGTTFIGVGFALIVVGAILKFAVSARQKGFNFHSAGLIGIWAGALAVVIGLLLVFVGGSHKSTPVPRQRGEPHRGPSGSRNATTTSFRTSQTVTLSDFVTTITGVLAVGEFARFPLPASRSMAFRRSSSPTS